jgi:4-amino-4-deoxy-L-arabinose transferase-like glycosyltransferase
VSGLISLGPRPLPSSASPDPEAAFPDLRRPTRGQWACLAGLLMVAALAYALPLRDRPLWSQDEARVALLAGDTLQRGLRLPAHVRETPYLNKPPLYFWSVALVSWPGGQVSERTAPIPSVIAALVALAGVFAIGRLLTGPSTGFVAVAVLATSPGFFLHSHQVLPDMALTAALTWALYFLLRALRAVRPRPAHLVGFYACVAAALWIKGMAALLVLPAALAATVAARGWRGVRDLRPGLGLAIVAVAILPWAIPYAVAPGHESSQSMGARAAIRWYLDRSSRASELIPLGGGFVMFLPWTLWLVPAALWWWRTPDRDTYRPLVAWMLVEAALLALSVQQRARYLLIVYPVFALLVAAAVTASGAGARTLIRLQGAVVAVLALALAVIGTWLLLRDDSGRESTPLEGLLSVSAEGPFLLVLLLAGLAGAFLTLRAGGSPARALACVAGSLALVLLVEAWIYPARLIAQTPVRAFAQEARPKLDPRLPVLGHPDASLAFDLYFDHPVREEPQRAAVVRRLERPAEGALLLREKGWAELGPAAHPSWCPLARAAIGEREFILVGACR